MRVLVTHRLFIHSMKGVSGCIDGVERVNKGCIEGVDVERVCIEGSLSV